MKPHWRRPWRTGRLLGILIAAAFPWSAAHAQQISDLQESVEQRIERREMPDGIRLASWTLRPSAEVELIHDDNVHATATDPQGDAFIAAELRASLASDFTRHALSGDAFYRRREFFTVHSESVGEYGASLAARYDIDNRSNVTLRGRYQHLAERRGDIDSLVGAIAPAEFDTIEGQLTAVRRFNRFGVALDGLLRKFTYDDVEIGGIAVDQRRRNFTLAKATITADYELSSATSFLVRGEAERRRYELRLGDPGFDPAELDRSADGVRIEAGLSRRITNLISGTARFGYMRYTYPDRRIPAVQGLSYDINLRWDVTPLTTISLQALRRLDETLSPESAGNLRDEVTFRVQHELLRTVIIGAEASHASIDASGTLPDSTDFRIGARVRWYATRDITIEAGFSHRRRNSDSAPLDFTINQASIGIVIRR